MQNTILHLDIVYLLKILTITPQDCRILSKYKILLYSKLMYINIWRRPLSYIWEGRLRGKFMETAPKLRKIHPKRTFFETEVVYCPYLGKND